MKEIRQAQKKYCSRAMTLAIFIGFALILAGLKPIGKGLILGTVFSIVNFILMGETLPMRLGKSKGRIFLASLGSILIRYVILAIPVVAAIKFKQFNFFAAVAGLFMVQFVLLADHMFGMVNRPSFMSKTAKGKQ